MNKNGPIVVIEDDEDDRDLFELIYRKLGCKNELVFLPDGMEALQYLESKSTNPFLILSDINLPKLDGFALKEKIQNSTRLQLRCVPYLFFTTSAAEKTITDAYSKSVQGFFVKPSGIANLERTLKTIIDYWKECKAPENSDQC